MGKLKSRGMIYTQGVQLRTWVKVGKRKWSTNQIDEHGRVSEEKELVDTGDEDSPHETHNPSAESR